MIEVITGSRAGATRSASPLLASYQHRSKSASTLTQGHTDFGGLIVLGSSGQPDDGRPSESEGGKGGQAQAQAGAAAKRKEEQLGGRGETGINPSIQSSHPPPSTAPKGQGASPKQTNQRLNRSAFNQRAGGKPSSQQRRQQRGEGTGRRAGRPPWGGVGSRGRARGYIYTSPDTPSYIHIQ